MGKCGIMQANDWDNDWKNVEIYPLVNQQFAIENGPVEIVDVPINSMVDFPQLCKRLPEANQ